VQHRLRNIVWRELPYSARRSIVGVLHAIDDFEAFWIGVWRSLTYSPAWIFVAICGGVGILLTILLFFLLTQELLAGGTRLATKRPVVEAVTWIVTNNDTLDTRLCLDDLPTKPQPYPADFGYGDAIQFAERRPVSRPPARQVVIEEPDFSQPRTDDPFPDWPTQPAAMIVEAGQPSLQVAVNHIRPGRIPATPLAPAQVLTARSLTDLIANIRIDENLPDDWSRFRDRLPAAAAEPYLGDRSVMIAAAEELNGDDFTAWPNRADVGLRIELYAPQNMGVAQAGQSRVTIENLGDDTIRRLEIQEPTQPLGMVTQAEPPAALNESVLYRELRRLGARRSKSLSVEWTPQTTGSLQHQARILAEAHVAASVDIRGTQPERIAIEPAVRMEPVVVPIEAPVPEPALEPEPTPEIRRPPRRSVPAATPVVPADPPVEVTPPAAASTAPDPQPAILCRVSHASHVVVNGMTEVEIEVENTGNVSLKAVKIFAAIPENLHHQHGDQVEYAVGDLAAGQVRRAVLRVVGQSAGVSTTRILAVSQETTSNDAQAVLDITDHPQPPVRQALPAVVKPKAARCNCDCPPQQVTWIERPL